MSDYRSTVKDADFRCQYDATPQDPEVDALLRGIEPTHHPVPQPGRPQLTILEPPGQFRWLKPLR